MRESECADRVMLSKGVCSLSSKTPWGKKQRLCTILKRCPSFSSSLLSRVGISINDWSS